MASAVVYQSAGAGCLLGGIHPVGLPGMPELEHVAHGSFLGVHVSAFAILVREEFAGVAADDLRFQKRSGYLHSSPAARQVVYDFQSVPGLGCRMGRDLFDL